MKSKGAIIPLLLFCTGGPVPVTEDVLIEPLARLRVESEGTVAVMPVALFLRSLNETYESIYVAEQLLPVISDAVGYAFKVRKLEDGRDVRIPYDIKTPKVNTIISALNPWQAAGVLVPETDRLLLKAVEVHSPSFWEFLGRLNPLEVIRLGLQDAHERRKDRQYREDAERRKLELENALRETQVLKERIEMAKAMGATEVDLGIFLNRFVTQPLLNLGSESVAAGMGNAEIERFDE